MYCELTLYKKERVFRTQYVKARYWILKLGEKDKENTAFVIHHALHRYTRVKICFKQASNTFQRATNVILVLVKGEKAIVQAVHNVFEWLKKRYVPV